MRRHGASEVALRVFIPLHTDATLFSGKELGSIALDALVNAAGDALAERLDAIAATAWPDLRQVYVDCMLMDASGTQVKDYRFRKKDGQLLANHTVDCAPLFDKPVEEQATAIMGLVMTAIEAAFDKYNQPALARIAAGFATDLKTDYSLHAKSSGPAGEDEEIMFAADLPAAEADGRIRCLRELPGKRGSLWVMARLESEFGDDESDTMLKQWQQFITQQELGRNEGSSVGAFAMDASFKVQNLAKAGKALDAFLRATFPGVDYVISDDFEVVFVDLVH